jgi:hypothetical protein
MEMQIIAATAAHDGTPSTAKKMEKVKKASPTSMQKELKTNVAVAKNVVEDSAVTDFSILPNEEESFDLLLMKMLSTGQGDEQLEAYLKDHTNDYSRLEDQEVEEGQEEERQRLQQDYDALQGYKEQDMTMIDLSMIQDSHYGIPMDLSVMEDIKPHETIPTKKEVFILKPVEKVVIPSPAAPDISIPVVMTVNVGAPTSSISSKNKGNKSPRAGSTTKSANTAAPTTTTTSIAKKKAVDAVGKSSNKTKAAKGLVAEESSQSQGIDWNDSGLSSNTPNKMSTTVKTSQTTGKKKMNTSAIQRESSFRENSTRLSVATGENVGIAAMEQTINPTVTLGSMTAVKIVPKPPMNGDSTRNGFKRRGVSGRMSTEEQESNRSKELENLDANKEIVLPSGKTNKIPSLTLSIDVVVSSKQDDSHVDPNVIPHGLSTPKASRVKSDKEDENRGTESVPMTPIGMLVSNVADQSPVVSMKKKITAGIAALSPGAKSKNSGPTNPSKQAEKVGKSPSIRRKLMDK